MTEKVQGPLTPWSREWQHLPGSLVLQFTQVSWWLPWTTWKNSGSVEYVCLSALPLFYIVTQDLFARWGQCQIRSFLSAWLEKGPPCFLLKAHLRPKSVYKNCVNRDMVLTIFSKLFQNWYLNRTMMWCSPESYYYSHWIFFLRIIKKYLLRKMCISNTII